MNYRNTQEFLSFLESDNTKPIIEETLRNGQITNYLEYLQHRPNCNKTGGLSPSYINKHITTLRLIKQVFTADRKSKHHHQTRTA
jgi:integrase/recombinase XerD